MTSLLNFNYQNIGTSLINSANTVLHKIDTKRQEIQSKFKNLTLCSKTASIILTSSIALPILNSAAKQLERAFPFDAMMLAYSGIVLSGALASIGIQDLKKKRWLAGITKISLGIVGISGIAFGIYLQNNPYNGQQEALKDLFQKKLKEGNEDLQIQKFVSTLPINPEILEKEVYANQNGWKKVGSGLDCMAFTHENLPGSIVKIGVCPFRQQLFTHCIDDLRKEDYPEIVLPHYKIFNIGEKYIASISEYYDKMEGEKAVMKLPRKTLDQVEKFIEEFQIDDVGLPDINLGALGDKVVIYDLEFSGRKECLPPKKSRFADWFPWFYNQTV